MAGRHSFDGVIFDLDGVITKTASLHSAAWKKVFDDYLQDRENRFNEPFREFSIDGDYLTYVDGKLRYEGARSFLSSRGVNVEFGDPSDDPELETVCGIANRKNAAFLSILQEQGVEAFPSTIALIHELSKEGLKIGIASASKNCGELVRAIDLQDLIEVRIDGVVSEKLGLQSKPHPDLFVTAASQLGIQPNRAVVVEDATSGVKAGRDGNFGLVIGVARHGNELELLSHGADLVVPDLESVSIASIDQWFEEDLPEDGWSLEYHGLDLSRERSRESLLAVGNGFICTRGALEESHVGGLCSPGTYMAALYNRLISPVSGKDLANEDFVNSIQWSNITFSVNEGEWFDPLTAEVLSISRRLDLRKGMLERVMVVKDPEGHETRVVSRRCISMAERHLAAMEYSITPLNYSGSIAFRATLSGDHENQGVERYKELNQRHLEPVMGIGSGNLSELTVQTSESKVRIINAAAHYLSIGKRSCAVEFEHVVTPGRVETLFNQAVEAGETLTVEKIIGVYNSKDKGVADPAAAARKTACDPSGFCAVVDASEAAWRELWEKVDIVVEGDRLGQKLLRLHTYHMLAAASPLSADLSWGVPARGLHGEAYRGHIFWDELYFFPWYCLQMPEVARSVLRYRYDRLDAARSYAKASGFKGAMFPWQSGSDGREETPTFHLNPVSGKWGVDHSCLQRHVSLAVAYNVWQYYWITGDLDFMQECGAEILFEVSRFWASKCTLDPATGRYSIEKVMGPDEFHEGLPEAEEGGLRDNTYTNVMVAWLFDKAEVLYQKLDSQQRGALEKKIGLTENEIQSWGEIDEHLRLVVDSDGVLAQFDGYFDLQEVDWEYYRSKYGNVYRMDRLLKAEGLSPDAFKVAKQADALMLFYNLESGELDNIFNKLSYTLPTDYIKRNFDYYIDRTSHGSTLSRLVFGVVAAKMGDYTTAWDLYRTALQSDFSDVQGGTTGEGIHSGVMGGTILTALTAFGGLSFHSDVVTFSPVLPNQWEKLSFRFSFRGEDYLCRIDSSEIEVLIKSSLRDEVPIVVAGSRVVVPVGGWRSYSISR